MKCEQLRNYGKLVTAKPSTKVVLSSLTLLPGEVGILGTPKFLLNLQKKERYYKRRKFRSAAERGITYSDFIDGIRSSLAFVSALVDTCGREKAMEVYRKFVEKISVLMYAEFCPTVDDFLKFPSPWEAFIQYFREFMRAQEREGVARFEVVCDTPDEYRAILSDCGFYAMYEDGGYPEVGSLGGECDVLFIPTLARPLGGDFTRETWLCRGDTTCDWHFHRKPVHTDASAQRIHR
jgi:L-2-amino-thiazoline-4-carboxylic acid hydrolase